MRQQVQRKLEAAMATLATIPDSYMFANFQPGSRDPMPDIPEGLRDLLAITDGFNAGDVAIFSYRELDRNQFYIDDSESIELMGGDRDRWLCFGLNNDFPLIIERTAGTIWWFPETWLEYSFMATRFEQLADSIDDFIDRFLLGEGYLQLIGGQDRWSDFLHEHGFITTE